VSIDQIHLYTSGTGSQTGLEGTLGTLRYSLGAFLNDNTVTLNYDLNSGSGQGDMRMYIPLTSFAGVGASDFVYLYSHFGNLDDDHRTGDGFEEWSVIAVPAPGALALLAMAGLVGSRRRRHEA
jgi:MYXO-CTERM domain-containing protein